ncbi:DUF1992 domain-containing protein [Streptomyces sp. NPDC051940]|uniref:DnaJ family domain-containing protein n=1 Tax=Streptomyces sp. NPDC051940 TaxID=3155675 RepID=UPI00343D67EB
MTERKPTGIDFESWIDRQIREATQRGEFENLPGKGKPLTDDDAPYDELWWVKQKLARENFSALPPTLVLRKEAEDALAAARTAPSERVLRKLLDEVNDRIREAIRRPPMGPPLNMGPIDVDAVAAEWRAARPEEPVTEPEPAPAPERRSRAAFLFRRRRAAPPR